MNVVMFGQSHFFGDLFDIIQASGHRLSKVVLNCEEKQVPRRPAFRTRVDRLPYKVEMVNIDQFVPRAPEFYVIGFSGKKMLPLLDSLRKFGLRYEPLVHPSALIQCEGVLGEGAVIDARAIVGPWATVGSHATLNRGASIGHDSFVGAYSFIGPGAHLSGHVKLGEDVFVGTGAAILPDVTIGDGAVIAAGSVVTKDVPPRVMVAGVPAVAKKTLV